MPAQISFSFHGDQQLKRVLLRFSDNVGDARPAWESIANRFARIERQQFASQGRFSGGWAPLSPPYRAWKAKRYPGRKILQRTQHLYRSLTQRPFGIEVIEPHLMIIGSDVSYGRFHQRGTSKMPRRRPVELSEAARKEMVRTLQRFIVQRKV